MKCPFPDTFPFRMAIVFRLSAMGDVALLTGVLRYWHEKFQCQFIVITRAEWAGLFDNHPAVVGIEALTKEELGQKNYRAVCKKLAEKYADFPLLDMHSSLRSRLLGLYWKSAVYRYCKKAFLRRLFLWTKGKMGRTALLQTNVCQRYASLLCPDSIEKKLLTPQIFLQEEEKDKAKNILSKLFPAKKNIIAIHPFATHKAKSFSWERWQEVGTAIMTELGRDYQLLWLGKGNLPETFTENTHSKSLVNKTDLRELCAVLSQVSLLVTGDSGPMHLANAVGTPLLALFGPTTEEWGFFPVGEKVHIIQKTMPCRPCSLHGKGTCKQEKTCLDQIGTEEILHRIQAVLAEKSKQNNVIS